MAGIGFTLRRMLQTGGFSGPLRAIAYAMIISAGPWLTSSATLALLGVFSALPEGSPAQMVFLAIVSYCFAFSLIGVGACQMVASRYLADRLYQGDDTTFAPAFARVAAPLFLLQAVLAGAFLAACPLTPPVRLAALLLYLAVSGTWLAMVYLSAAKDYRTIVLAFVGGFVVSVAAGLGLGHLAGLTGQLVGFTAGYVGVLGVLLWRLRREFGLPLTEAVGLLGYFRRYWQLVVIGLAYNTGIWIDKILFWYHPASGVQVAGPLFVAPIYDNAMFMAYLTIVPALGMFLLRVETDFYDAYRAYFAAIAAHERLGELNRVKAEMAAALWRNLALVLKVQAPITLGAILFAPEIIAGLKLDWLSVFVFRFGAIGALLHVLHLMVLILLLYLDFRSDAMRLALVFLTSNLVFTLLAFGGGMPSYGAGYAFSCAVTLFYGLHLLGRAFEQLEYHVFMRQPLT